jgi:prepilin-type N-terminal cleavage/methylation domain-containing protein
MTAKQRATRAGFTLVELLMVIAIIAVLASLLIAGLGRVRRTARIVQATNDITQLETTATKFKQDFGFYPPSHVVCTRPNGTSFVARFLVPSAVPNPGGTVTDATLQNDACFAVLQRMFPRWQPGVPGSAIAYNYPTPDPVANPPVPALVGVPLDPNQSLAFFLGGAATLYPPEVRAKFNMQSGFNTGSPDVPTGTTKKGPYFDFPDGRMASITATDPAPINGYAPGNGLLSFVDPWKVPYAYFAAGGDNYDSRVTFPLSAGLNTDYGSAGAGTGVARPVRAGGKWLNPGKLQLLSAGPNQLFGPGSPLLSGPPRDTATPNPVYQEFKPGQSPGYTELDPGEDDLANFNEGSNLGTANN